MTLETLELFGEMYMTLSLFPLLLIIILVIMGMMGESDDFLLYATVYALIPLTGVGFLVLVSTVKQDEPGDGYLRPDGGSDRLRQTSKEGLLHFGLIEAFVGQFGVFDRIRNREGTYKTKQIVSAPHLFLRDNPAVHARADCAGRARHRRRHSHLRERTDDLRRLGEPSGVGDVRLGVRPRVPRAGAARGVPRVEPAVQAGDHGEALGEPPEAVVRKRHRADAARIGGNGVGDLHRKTRRGVRGGPREGELRDEPAGRLGGVQQQVCGPRLARTVKLISEAQEASSEITDVLTTAAQASENQDDIERNRISQTRMQVAIIVMTYVTLLGVMAILQTQFIDVMGDLSSQADGGGASGGGGAGFGGGGGVDPDVLSMLFFHAVTLQAVLSGFISGYIRNADIVSGVKFAVVLMTLALGVWIYVG